jgi:hypothetical protein
MNMIDLFLDTASNVRYLQNLQELNSWWLLK